MFKVQGSRFKVQGSRFKRAIERWNLKKEKEEKKRFH
jgi:hypothetical protein